MSHGLLDAGRKIIVLSIWHFDCSYSFTVVLTNVSLETAAELFQAVELLRADTASMSEDELLDSG
jgi:hypothetical protein